ncbi:B-cell receptor CD22-like [Engraulis encrasicolus]|uniref:B-cell receptor CD22-like n=1 Tax=Engraulis encrasicolus TaxID=184585 RepID=UPI002FD64BEB
MPGSTVTILCSFTHPAGLEVTKVFWSINPKKGVTPTDLMMLQQYSDRVQYNSDIQENCTMTLRDVRRTDIASYHVKIETSRSTEKWLSSPVLFTVRDAPVLAVQTSGPAVEGRDVKLSCVSDCALRPNSRIMWEKDGHAMPDAHKYNENLVLYNIRSGNEGAYTCIVEGQENHRSSPLGIKVMYPPKNTYTSVRPVGDILQGSAQVSLRCYSDAVPPARYTWYRRTGETSSLVVSDKIYRIAHITSEHSGYYYCTATNVYGSNNSTDLHVNVQYPPKTTLILISPIAEVLEGDTVIMSCRSDANPPASFAWYWKGNRVQAAKQKNYSLIAVRSEDTGDYYCQAQNKHGDRNSTLIHLNVLYPPKRTSAFLFHKGDLNEGTSVILSCNSNANPPVENYTWYKKTSASTEVTQTGSGQFNTFTLSPDTVGVYHCEAKNSLGTQDSAAIEVSASGQVQWQTATLCVLGAIVAVQTLTIVLIHCRRKRSFGADYGDTGRNAGDSVTGRNTEGDDDYVNNDQRRNSLDIPMVSLQSSVLRSLPNNAHTDDVYQSLNPNTIEPNAVYHSLRA